MELPTHRHRDITVLVLVLVVQLLLLGYQVRGPEDTRLVRVWAVSAVTPVAKLLETARRGVTSVLDNYVFLVGARRENQRLQEELNQLKLESLIKIIGKSLLMILKKNAFPFFIQIQKNG